MVSIAHQSLRLLAISGLWLGAPRAARGELAHALDTIPRPHVRLMFDNSVTMNISLDCSGCHSPTRMETAKSQLLQTLPLLENYFVFSGARYAGCEYAKIVESHMPDFDDPIQSYASVLNMIDSAQACGTKESRLGNAQSATVLAASAPAAVIERLAAGGLPGFNPLLPFQHVGCGLLQDSLDAGVQDFQPCINPDGTPSDAMFYQGACYHIGCGSPPSPANFQQLVNIISTIDWPRWLPDDGITAQQVRSEFCQPISDQLQLAYDQLSTCSPPPSVLNGTPFGDLESWCNSAVIASTACDSGSPLSGTCVCDDSDTSCLAGFQPTINACNNVLDWKARQQIAICDTYSPALQSAIARPDNVAMGGCRENHALFFTDGYMGHTRGAQDEALQANTRPLPIAPIYQSPMTQRSNMAVFHLSSEFTAHADAMMSAVTMGEETQRLDATNLEKLQASFAEVLNRAYKGVYTGAGTALDDRGTRIAMHTFTVPGYNATGPSEDYLGWPARISWHAIDENGAIETAPVFETDQASRVFAQVPGCGRKSFKGPGGAAPSNIPGLSIPTVQSSPITSSLPVSSTDSLMSVGVLGPGGSFKNGISRTAAVIQSDRDGDMLPDSHDPVVYGRMFSTASTKPVVVENGLEIVNSSHRAKLIEHLSNIQDRHRTIYTWANGQLISFFAGESVPARTKLGGQTYQNSYDDSQSYAGAEIARYEPGWVELSTDDYDFRVNNLIQQPITTGELAVRETLLRTGSGPDDVRWATLLVGAQGQTGRGMFAMDVTNPCNPVLTGEWVLPPQYRASAEPAIYAFPTPMGPQTAILMTGGLGGPPELRAYDFRGDALATVVLPPDDYPTAPVCLSPTGEEHVSHCYLVSSSGRLVRVTTTPTGGFDVASTQDLTPAGVIGGGRVFYTSPTAYYGVDNSVNLVFGSGDFRNLDQADGVQNHFYRVVDRAVNSTQPNRTADLEKACGRGPRISGDFALAAGERVISKAIVRKGVVAWTTITPQSNGCIPGATRLYTMDFERCTDANNGAANPEPLRLNTKGLSLTPTFHGPSNRVIATASGGPTAGQVESLEVRARGGRSTLPITKRYWRQAVDSR